MQGTTVNIHEAKTHFSKLIARVQAGEEIVVAKAGKAVARLLPTLPTARRRPPREWAGIEIPDSAFFDPMPAEELARWEGQSDPLVRS
ncbi:MAG: type II toxin-antitoxin system prevent-host-death family antitoxin [Verrucomicrobiae bacterium]